MRKKILLTGGHGFIGKNILESFLSEKYDITAPSSQSLNLIDEEEVETFFKDKHFDVIIHAAVKPTHRNAKDFNNLFYSNTRMFFNLERQDTHYDKMLVIGSGAIYDARHYRPKMKEEEWTQHIPSDDHGYCKYVCEKVIEHNEKIFDLRVFGIFGRYEDYAIRFISNAICKTLYDLPITIKQNRRFDYIYIDDLMPILDWFITNQPKHKSYNITPDHSISLYELAELVRRIANKPNHSIIVAKDGMGLEYSGDNNRLHQEINELCFTNIETSIRELYSWYASHLETIDKNCLLTDK